MRKAFIWILALFCFSLTIPAAFAGEDVPATDGADRPWFKPTLRVGSAFDVGDGVYYLHTENLALAGLIRSHPKLPSAARVYLAAELPVSVTDRLTLSVGGSWAFYTRARDVHESLGFAVRNWDRDNRDDWVSADFTVSYAIVKDVSIIKNLSVVGSLRWDYRDMFFTDPYVAAGAVASLPADELDIKTQTLAPVFGLTCTLAGRKSGLFGGDIKFGALAGPVVWGTVDWRETFATPMFHFGFKGHPSHGYVVNTFVELPVYSGAIKPGLDGSVSFFADYTRTFVNGPVGGARYSSGVLIDTSPYHFESLSNVMVLGINASFAF
jgi:hypothetical protein